MYYKGKKKKEKLGIREKVWKKNEKKVDKNKKIKALNEVIKADDGSKKRCIKGFREKYDE